VSGRIYCKFVKFVNFARVGRAIARDALCRGFDPCRQRPHGVALIFGPKQCGWFIYQLGDPSFEGSILLKVCEVCKF
jgi:hypothetical protein